MYRGELLFFFGGGGGGGDMNKKFQSALFSPTGNNFLFEGGLKISKGVISASYSTREQLST